MATQLVPKQLLEAAARRFRILAEPVRLMLLNHLNRSGEMSVQELVAATGQKQANVSKHLLQMCDAGILNRRRAGQSVYYSITDPTISAICLLVCGQLKERLQAESAVD